MANLSPNKGEPLDEESAAMVKETINTIKSRGIFDQYRKECLADVDTKVIFKIFSFCEF